MSPRTTSLPPCWMARLVVTACLSLGTAHSQVNPFADFLLPTFQKNCIKCHGEKGKVKGKVNLFKLESAADLTHNLELVEDMIDVLEFEEMPPEKEPPLAPEVRKRLVAELRSLLSKTVAEEKSYAPTPLRRMNRFQYNNAVQDLFALKPVVFTLPERMLRDHSNYFQPASGKMPDNLKAGSRPLGKSQLIEKRLAGVTAFPQDLRAEHGFDNRGDHLTLSPLLLESFLKLSRSIVESPDFNQQNVGIWKEFFAAPPPDADLEKATRARMWTFLTRAFRRPVEEQLVERYAGHLLAQVKAGQSYTDSAKESASAALASPRFLYLYERAATKGRSERVDDFELASRLSFFLWGSIPDAELLARAGKQTLHQPEILTEQIDRMLNHAHLKRFCDSFPSQWLQLERIVSSIPNQEKFPSFFFAKYRASMHMMLEPLLLFETVLVEDRSILQLIDPDFSYRSGLLEAWYRDDGKPRKGGQVTAIAFKRVPVKDRRQGGVITNAAVMTMTSNPNRTQPITRGAWIASVIFNDPPEPPPADVPPLPEVVSADTAKLTLRERFETHRTRPDCAGCHVRIDPLGFALENYGPTGIWRDKYANGRTVDSSGVLFKKHKFTDPVEFKDAILAEKDRFARGFAAHLLSFSLGREVGPADSPALDQIVAESAEAGYRLRSMIRQVALSEPFHFKSNPVTPPAKPRP